jgi:hypothetical protein
MNEELQTTEEVTETTENITPQDDIQTETEQTPVEAPTQENEQAPQEINYKEKFKESAREGILQHERLKQKEARINQLTNKDTPQDDEMRSIYSNWDELDDHSKTFYRNDRAREKRLAHLEQLTLTQNERREFEEKLEDFTDSLPDQYKGIQGKESEFKRFAKKKDNAGLPMDTLAKAFLFDIQDELPKPHTPTLTPGLEKGTGGPRTAPKTKISLEDAVQIRQTDYKRYMELVRTGQIDDEI